MPTLTFLVPAAIAAASPGHSASEPTAPPVSIRGNAAEMVLFARRLRDRGLIAQAQQILEFVERDPDRGMRNIARYERAVMLEAAGKDREAAVLLRRVVDEDAAAGAARLRLATLLHRMGQSGAAQRELRTLRSTDLPPVVARFVDRLSASVQASKPLGFQLEVAIAPDSNITRATAAGSLETIIGDFTISDEARSGIGLALRGLGQARVPLSRQLSLVARGTADASLYRRSDFDDIALDIAAGPELTLGRTRLSAEAAVIRQYYGLRLFRHGYRLSASGTRAVDPVSQLRVDAGWRHVDDEVNALRSGDGLSLRARYERALSPQLIVAASAGADRFEARDAAHSTRSWTVALAAYRDVGRATVGAGVEFGRLKADERLFLLPQARADRLLRFHVSSVFRQLTVGGFAPVARLVLERNRSSVEFYDYKRTRTEFGVTRAF